MSPTRREFIKDMAAVGAVATASVGLPGENTHSDMIQGFLNRNTCPYFDQPLHCKGLSRYGRPMCEE